MTKALKSEPAPSTDPAETESTDDLNALLSSLPDAQREVLIMRFVDGLSVEEIAQALKIPTGTVKTRTHHAIRKLRESPAAKKFFTA